jgi:PAS domain S-box-containing protein
LRPPRSLEDALEQTDEPAFVIDPRSGRLVAANAAGCSLLGCCRNELLGTSVSQVLPGQLPQLEELLDRVARQGRGSTITLTCRTRFGASLPIELSLYAFDCDDQAHVLALVDDRSDHRRR